MPNYDWTCVAGHVRADHYVHVLGIETVLCDCGETMHPVASFGRGLTYFEEGRGRWIHNLGPQPVYVTSHEQHKAEMKKAGVEWSTGWAKQKTGGWV